MKFDGIRLILTLDRERLRLASRNDKDLTASFPELADLGAALVAAGHSDIMLDGELVSAQPGVVPSLGAIAPRIHRRRATASDIAAIPVTYVVFDILGLDGRDLRKEPYEARRALLESVLPGGRSWTVAESFPDGDALWRATDEQGIEGVVAKRRSSGYRPGIRSADWVKAVHTSTTDTVILGWRFEEGRRSSRVGALVVAEVRSDGLHPVGRVGSGMTQDLSDALVPVLESIETESPAIPVPGLPDSLTRWCQPLLVLEVRHLGYGSDGQLRHPVIARLRPDLTADELEPRNPA